MDISNLTVVKITAFILLTFISFLFLTYVGRKYNKIGLKVLALIPIINILAFIFIAWTNFIVNITGEVPWEDK